MGNYENIKPYSDINHIMAQHGGVDKYLNHIENIGRQKGILEEKNASVRKVTIAAVSAIAFWESGKWVLKKAKELFETKQEEKIVNLTEQAEAAKAAFRSEVAFAERMNKDSSYSEPENGGEE